MDLWQAIREHWVWATLTAAVVLWYSTVTVYVALRGMVDIRSMLDRLKQGQEVDAAAEEKRPE